MNLAEALAITEDARLITTAKPPYKIVHSNRAWSLITGWSFTEAVGRTPSIVQGPATRSPALQVLETSIREGRAVSATVVNYRRDGTPFPANIE